MIENPIFSRIEEFDISMREKEGRLKVMGHVITNFQCNRCYKHCSVRHDINEAEKIYRCEDCGERYLVSVCMPVVTTRVQGEEVVKLVEQMHPIIEQIKREYIMPDDR